MDDDDDDDDDDDHVNYDDSDRHLDGLMPRTMAIKRKA